MTDKQPAADDGEVIEIDQTDRRSLWPFIAAACFAAVVLVAIVLGGVLSPAEKNVTTADRIAGAVRDFVSGVNNTDSPAAPGSVCQGFDPKRSPLADRPSGKTVEITKIENPSADGDRAKANVTVEIDGNERTTTWNLTRSGDRWLVCD
ncbi:MULTISPECIES: hypothetical protein [unclassified Nocardia]|uniref:Rv0361 family membrane protein n=1 Tax=unclassified Nocardia TaxID=2637762 RepID=UPI001CE413E9|nr:MULTISPECIES: hypothetical protein [unclassified Nocardia]